jgi:hypothetical protein
MYARATEASLVVMVILIVVPSWRETLLLIEIEVVEDSDLFLFRWKIFDLWWSGGRKIEAVDCCSIVVVSWKGVAACARMKPRLNFCRHGLGGGLIGNAEYAR